LSERARPRRPSRRRWHARTLLGRLTVGMVVVLLVACAVLGVTSELVLHTVLLNQLDAQLEAAGGRYSASLEHEAAETEPSADRDDSIPGQSVGTLGIRLVAGRITEAAVVTEEGTNRKITLDAYDRFLVGSIRPGEAPKSIDMGGLGDYRLRAVRGKDGDIQVTGLPLHPIKQTLAELFAVDAALFAFLLLAGGFATALVVRRNLRPLHQLTSTALEFSEQALTDPESSLPTVRPDSEAGSEVDQLNVAFHRMLDRIQQALNARDVTEARLRRFVADASHELRTPLSTIQAHVEYASTTDAERLPASTVNALDRVTAATGRMSNLVADLLLLARLDAGRSLARTSLDLTRLVLEAVNDARAAAPDHRWKLDLPEEVVTVTGDPERLHQVLANLLANAKTHTPPGTTVTIRIRVAALSVDVSVVDDGPGIPEELQPRLFDRFTRGDTSRSRAHGSSGLGLAIAHSIVNSHGGTLTVRSSQGEGTTFTMRLPRSSDS
jgi:two-component system, OmpR family, sensor kinase